MTVSAFLMGHVPEGMSPKYLLRWALSSGPAIREAQHKISREIMALLKSKPHQRSLRSPRRAHEKRRLHAVAP
jgi:hypothetical protein